MKMKSLLKIVVSLGVSSFLMGCGASAEFESNVKGATTQKIAIPSYFRSSTSWAKMNAASAVLPITVINPNSGPAAYVESTYTGIVQRTRKSNQVVIAYVTTDQFNESGYKAPIELVKQNIDTYFTQYPGINGIFLDEGYAKICDAGKESAFAYYLEIYTYIKTKYGQVLVVVNPGAAVNECFMQVTDIVVNAETYASDYITKWKAKGWESKYPANRFWHMIHSSKDISEIPTIIGLSKKRNAGFIVITDVDFDKPGLTYHAPWNALPSDAYLQATINALQ